MKRLKILKSENEIMELFIAYGLCHILRDNDLQWELVNKKSYFLIEVENDFLPRDLVLNPLEEQDLWNVNSSLNRVEKARRLEAVNQYFDSEENMERVFNYYETLDEKYVKGTKKEGATYSGTVYYTKGVRGASSANSQKIIDFQNQLSFLGFVSVTTYCLTDYDVNAVLIPRRTSQLRLPFVFTGRDKETGEIKRHTYFSKTTKSIISARIYLQSVKEFQYESVIKDYEKVAFMQMAPTAKKPMADKVLYIPVEDISIELCDDLLKKLEFSNISDDVKYATAAWVLSMNEGNFFHYLKMCSKKNVLIEKDRLEELIALQNKRVQEIFNSESVKILGRGLNRLIRDKRGYEVQVALLNCHSIQVLTEIIRDINLLYYKNYKGYCLNENNILETIQFAETDKAVQVLANAILTYSTVYFEKKTVPSGGDN